MNQPQSFLKFIKIAYSEETDDKNWNQISDYILKIMEKYSIDEIKKYYYIVNFPLNFDIFEQADMLRWGLHHGQFNTKIDKMYKEFIKTLN